MWSAAGRNGIALLVAWYLLQPTIAWAQRGNTELGEAFELERRGRYELAAGRYRSILEESPANLSALLGLERVLVPIGQLDTIIPYIESAVVLQPQNRSMRTLQLRVFAELDQPNRVSEAARNWIANMPGIAEPYREWSSSLTRMGDTEGAREVLEEGAGHVGEAVLAQDMATLAVLDGDWVAAARHWRMATEANGSLLGTAVTNLTQVPFDSRSDVLNALTRDSADGMADRIAADLLVAWNRPAEGWTVLERSLPDDPQVAAPMLRRFADRTTAVRSTQGAMARGLALERLAQMSDGAAAQRARVEAARAFSEAGERVAAERMLSQIAQADGSVRGTGPNAAATLIGVMAESGRVEEAEEQLAELEGRLTVDDAAALRERIAWAWLRQGSLEGATRVLGDDSTVTVLAVRGWIALYGGDIRGATDYFRAAGPHAGSRESATERTAVLALLQSIEPDSTISVGAAFHRLTMGDTASAIDEFSVAAEELPEDGGRTAILTYAGRLALERGDTETAEEHLLRALQADDKAPQAPFAAYHLAEVYERRGESGEARDQLETLIITYPESAIVPLARRMLDKLRGVVPSR